MATNQEPTRGSERPATARAEELLDRLGQRFQDVRANVGRAFEQRAQRQGNGQGAAASQHSASAQETLGTWGERVGFVAGAAGRRVLQWGARAREEAEDLWAEAQNKRQQTTAPTAAAGSATRENSTSSEAARQHGKADVGYDAADPMPHHDPGQDAEAHDAGAASL